MFLIRIHYIRFIASYHELVDHMFTTKDNFSLWQLCDCVM